MSDNVPDVAASKPVPPDTLQFDEKVVIQEVWQWQVDYQLDESGTYEETFEGPDGDPMQGQVKLCLATKPGRQEGSKELFISLLTKRWLVGAERECVCRQNYPIEDGWTDRDTLTITFSRQASRDAGVPWYLHNFVVVLSVSFGKNPEQHHDFPVREELFTQMATMATAWNCPDDQYLVQCPRCGRSPLTVEAIHFGHLVRGDDLSSSEVTTMGLTVSPEQLEKLVQRQKPSLTAVSVECRQCEWQSDLQNIRLR